MQNVQRLHAIEALEAGSTRKPDPASGTDVELQRLETKLNLALDLLGTLLEQAVPRPEPESVELSSESACWIMQTPPALHSRGRLALYLHPLLAQPVILPGEIVETFPQEDGKGHKVKFDFDPMPDDTTDAFVAFVFRGHRRAIAEQRLQPRPENTDNNPS